MVKSGAERAEKYAQKYDEKAILLRWKAIRNWSIEKFRSLAFKQYLVQYVANQLCADYELDYGERGCLHDKVQKILFRYDTLTDVELDALKEEWIREGLPEEAFNELPDLFGSIKPFFEVCHFPTSKLYSRINVEPEPYLTAFRIKEETTFPIIEDFTDPITPTEQEETFYLLPERTEFNILETKVCAHNTIRALAPLFKLPALAYEAIPLTPFLNITIAFHTVYKQEPTLNIGVVKT